MPSTHAIETSQPTPALPAPPCPKPSSKSDYAYTRMLPRPAWAWEFLRRNPGYIRACCTDCIELRRTACGGTGGRYLRLRGRCARAERWGIIAFTDPALNGLEADVFWCPEHHPAVVSATAARSSRKRSGSILSLGNAHGRKAVLRQDGNVEHIVLRGREDILQVRCRGESVLAERIDVTFHLDDNDESETRLDAMVRLLALRKGARSGCVDAPWTQQTRRLRDMLIALDGSLGGASLRDTAAIIFGGKAVDGEWSSGRFLKDRVRRYVQRGRELMDGGYRDLLR